MGTKDGIRNINHLKEGIRYIDQMKEWIDISKGSYFKLRESISIDELYTLMKERWDTQRLGKFQLNRDMLSDHISLDDYSAMGLTMKISVSVTSYFALGWKNWFNKNKMVVIEWGGKGISANNEAKVRQIGETGYKEAFALASEHIRAVCAGMREVLGDKVL